MTNGVITGGWAYVWAAYGLTTLVFLLYGVTLFTRLREERSRLARERGGQ
jgi:heme exporter protein D